MDDALRVASSIIHENGVFATVSLMKNTTVCQLLGEEVTLAELVRRIDAGIITAADGLQVGPERYICLEEMYRCINHSCDPNGFVRGVGELVAMRDIAEGEEITYDYSTTLWEDKSLIRRQYHREPWTMQCSCGAANCRGVIDQFYLLPSQTQQHYIENGFVPDFIQRKMKATRVLRNSSS
jgi:hypothetical protein